MKPTALLMSALTLLAATAPAHAQLSDPALDGARFGADRTPALQAGMRLSVPFGSQGGSDARAPELRLGIGVDRMAGGSWGVAEREVTDVLGFSTKMELQPRLTLAGEDLADWRGVGGLGANADGAAPRNSIGTYLVVSAVVGVAIVVALASSEDNVRRNLGLDD